MLNNFNRVRTEVNHVRCLVHCSDKRSYVRMIKTHTAVVIMLRHTFSKIICFSTLVLAYSICLTYLAYLCPLDCSRYAWFDSTRSSFRRRPDGNALSAPRIPTAVYSEDVDSSGDRSVGLRCSSGRLPDRSSSHQQSRDLLNDDSWTRFGLAVPDVDTALRLIGQRTIHAVLLRARTTSDWSVRRSKISLNLCVSIVTAFCVMWLQY